MIFQEYYYQDTSNYATSRLNQAMSQWHGGALDAFTSAAEETHSQWTILGWLIDEAKESEVDDTTPILQDEWNKDHYLWRADVPWKEDLTYGIGEVRRDRSDRLNALSFRRANVDFWSLPNLSGVLMGAMGSPENLIAWGGMIGRAGTLSSLATKAPITARYFKPIARGMTDAAVADTLFQSVKATVQINRGEDPDLVHAAFEMGIATLAGGFLGTIPMAAQVAYKIPAAFRPAIVKKTLKDLKSGPANYFKSRARRNLEEELDPEATVGELNKRMQELDDADASLSADASKEAAKEYVVHTKGQFRNLIHKAANCVRRMGGRSV